jgi:hypothetical protein
MNCEGSRMRGTGSSNSSPSCGESPANLSFLRIEVQGRTREAAGDSRGGTHQGCAAVPLVVTPEGLPLAYEVLPGNTADNTTLRDFLARIERQYGKARRIWLMDRGIPTEVVLAPGRGGERFGRRRWRARMLGKRSLEKRCPSDGGPRVRIHPLQRRVVCEPEDDIDILVPRGSTIRAIAQRVCDAGEACRPEQSEGRSGNDERENNDDVPRADGVAGARPRTR